MAVNEQNRFLDFLNRLSGTKDEFDVDYTGGPTWMYSRVEDESIPGGWQPTYTFGTPEVQPGGMMTGADYMVNPVAAVADAAAQPAVAPTTQYQEYLANEPFDIAEMNQQAGITDGQKLAALLGLGGAALGYTGYKATRPDVPRSPLTKIGALDLRPVGSQGAFDFVGGSSGMPNASAAAGPMPQQSSPARNPRQMDIFDQDVPPQQPPKQERVAFKDRPRGGGFQPGEGGYKPPEGRGFKPKKVLGGTLGTLLSIPLFSSQVKAYEAEGYSGDAALRQTLLDYGLGFLNFDSSNLGDSDIPYGPEEGMFQGFSFVPYQQ